MSETGRDKIIDLFDKYQIRFGRTYRDSLLVNEILELIPQWRTFSNDCKPEEGSAIALKYSYTGQWARVMFYNVDLDFYVQHGHQWFPIPNE